MITITENYRDLNQHLHEQNLGFGANGWIWIAPALHFMRRTDSKTVLDYGAGKATFSQWMPPEYPVVNFDPATFPERPAPQDFTVCLDVLEHIEPDFLEAVLQDIANNTRKGALMVISTRPATKVLPDGRNAHLLIKDRGWWGVRLAKFFTLVEPVKGLGRADEFVVYLEK